MILLIHLSSLLFVSAKNDEVVIRARRQNYCGWAGYCGQQCCINIQVNFQPMGGCDCTGVQQACCDGLQTQFQQPFESSCCVQYEQPCQCFAGEPCCTEPTPSPTTTTTTPTTTTTLAPSTFATSTFAPAPSCNSCPAVPCFSCSFQPQYQVNVVVQCAPACQPSCHPSCVAQPVNAYSQYNMATTSCFTQSCVCSMGYVQCGQNTCCLRYRYLRRRSVHSSS